MALAEPEEVQSVREKIVTVLESTEAVRIIDDTTGPEFQYDPAGYENFGIFRRVDPNKVHPADQIPLKTDLVTVIGEVRGRLGKYKVPGRDCRPCRMDKPQEDAVSVYFAIGMFTFLAYAAPDEASPGKWMLGVYIAVDPDALAQIDD